MKELRGRVAVVTGGARGIGRATAVALLREGAIVAIADIDLTLARQTASELAVLGRVAAFPVDVTKRADFEALVERVERELGPIDLLVNNAGIMALARFLEPDDATEHKQMEINVFGVLNGMRAVIPRMLERRRGHIVNLASLAGRVGIPRAAAYSASKFAVIGATEAVRNELTGSGLEFTYVMPYLVKTELASGTRGFRWPPPVEPEEVASALVDGVKRSRVEVYVPRITALAASLPAVLPRAFTDWVARVMGLPRLFGRIDGAKRAAYVARTSVVPGAPPAKPEGADGDKPTKPRVLLN